jgi:hypothetical protein
MAFQITVRGIDNQLSAFQVDKTPDRCPLCQCFVTPIDWTTGAIREGGQSLERLLQCPNAVCRHLFLARYRNMSGHYVLQHCVPAEILTPVQSETIRAISEDFCNIYDEAHKAEQQNLKLVAGPGYRKALEFLIKDYVISQFPEKGPEKIAAHKTSVENMQLGACIEKYVRSDQIKGIAKRAAWLGNDETHYVRKWEGKDLDDLKKLISLTLHWIEIEKLTADVIQDMPDAKSQTTT